MKGKDILFLLVGLAAAAFAAFEIITFFRAPGPGGPLTELILGIVGVVVSGVFFVMFLSSRVNKEEEIHITQ
jgi:uncharacterized membrane protein YeaQ/YmgE (transglycosylase-associated protein family)